MAIPLILKKHKGFYTIPLCETLGARALFTTRLWNIELLDKKDSRQEACRKQAYKKLNISWRSLVCPSQVHEDNVALVDEGDGGSGSCYRFNAIPETDALITDKNNLPIGIRTADCLPIFIVDPERKAVALIHAGWKSLRKRIVQKTLQRMKDEFSVRMGNLFFALGPALRSCCYEVGKEFLVYFPGSVFKKNQKLYFDIIQEARIQIAGCGVAQGHIHDSGLCTSCLNHEFFSFRKEGIKAGRSLSTIEIL